MQVTIPQATLSRELALLAGVVEKKTTIPILSCVKIGAGPDGITLTATNLEQAVTSTVECEVTEPGEICLPAKRLQMLVGALSGDVAIKVSENHWSTITAGRSRSRIAGQSVESFPELPTAPESTVSLDARLLARQLDRVQFAISMEESRFTLNGALVEFSGSLVRCVTTDGHRLAWTEADAATGTETRFLWHKPAMVAYGKLADAAEGGARVAISQDDNHLFFAVGNRRLVTRRLVGTFPDYKRVLPNHDKHVVIDRDAFKAAIGRVAQFADERSRAARFAFTDGEVLIAASSVEVGESEETIGCDDGSLNVTIGFNAQYITDALGAIDHPKVAVFIQNEKSAGEIRPMAGAGTEQDPYRVGTDYRCVVMPMRI